ncbi:MAG: zinc ribbon domain-containing protein [Candidatus Lindowbacteria bacterium]|nr:zinc ribbon domain-containing protein [Candidatus Lindowbacteria bacterium]
MPIYEFSCRKCGRVNEVLIRTNLREETPACPECGSKDLERHISLPNVPKEQATTATPRCGQGHTCCGSSTPCEKPPCS